MTGHQLLTRAAGLIVLLLAGVSLAILQGRSVDAQAQGASQSFSATADAYVYSLKPTSNYALSPKLRVDGSPATYSLARFDVHDLTGSVAKATLSFYTVSGSSTGFDVHVVPDNSWSDSAITWSSYPQMDAAVVGSSGPFPVGVWTQVDVTSAVTGNGSYSFGLTTSATANISLSSKEGLNAPRLVVQTTDGGTPATTGTTGTTGTTTTQPTTGTTTTQPTTGTTTTQPTVTNPPTTTAPSSSPPVTQTGFPIRAAFYYPWFPEAWSQQGLTPFTKYHPTLGYYDLSTSVIQKQIEAMRGAGLTAGISSWWGQGSNSDQRFSQLLTVADSLGSGFKWALYYEPEGQGDPSIAQIKSDLTYIDQHFAADPAYLKVGGKPVIFVYNSNDLTCAIVDKWKSANTDFYVDLKVFSGYRTCTSQPDSWHQYGPAVAESDQAGYSFSISPGFFKANETTPRLARDPARWAVNVLDMVKSGAPWQLVTTFNEWGEGTSVESATEWQSSSGAGTYLDALGAAIGSGQPSAQPAPQPQPQPQPTASSSDPVVAAAGDIACDPTSSLFNGGNGSSSSCRQKWTSDLLLNMPNLKAVLTLGDNQYETNTLSQYMGAFDLSWGRVKSLIRPAIGNHEYLTTGATGYFQYFGTTAGDPLKGYYSFDAGSWHLLSLNSECSHIGGCGSGSPEEQWVKADLAAHPNACTLAYWHEPRFSSGEHGDAQQMATIWNDLVAGRVDVVMSGHNHDYERFDPIGVTPPGTSTTGASSYQDPVLDANGIREFVVGTGGKNHYGFGSQPPLAGEVVRDSSTYGVLKLTLHSNGYDWQFVNDPGSGSFTDSGSGVCH